jgi:hypothetical protein
MNRPSPFASNSFFKPATSIFGASNSHGIATYRRSPSVDDSDTEAQRFRPQQQQQMMNDALSQTMANRSRYSPELKPGSTVTLTNVSRSPSPYARSRSLVQSEDEEEYELRNISQSRPLVAMSEAGEEQTRKQRVFQRGGLGRFLFGTAVGWRAYLGLLVFWVGGCQFGTLLMNRFILWTGTYKFPYPLTLTLLQLCITHLFLLGFAALTRGLATPLRAIGLGAVIAPSRAYNKGNRPTRYTSEDKIYLCQHLGLVCPWFWRHCRRRFVRISTSHGQACLANCYCLPSQDSPVQHLLRLRCHAHVHGLSYCRGSTYPDHDRHSSSPAALHPDHVLRYHLNTHAPHDKHSYGRA